MKLCIQSYLKMLQYKQGHGIIKCNFYNVFLDSKILEERNHIFSSCYPQYGARPHYELSKYLYVRGMSR